jgi:hypothetical protein
MYLKHLGKGIFTVPKLISYSAQKDPFIHIDNDLFLYGKISEKELNSKFLVWCLEPYAAMYLRASELLSKYSCMAPVAAVPNTGVFVVNDIEKKDEYCDTVFNIFDKIIEDKQMMEILSEYDVKQELFSVGDILGISIEQLILAINLDKNSIPLVSMNNNKIISSNEEIAFVGKSIHCFGDRKRLLKEGIRSHAIFRCGRKYYKKIKEVVNGEC